MKLVTKYQISAINSCREKYLGTDGRTDVKQYTPLGWSGGTINICKGCENLQIKKKNTHLVIHAQFLSTHVYHLRH